MVELFLDRFQIVKDVRMIELKVIEDQRTRAVMDEFRTLIEKRAVIFIGFDDKNGLSPSAQKPRSCPARRQSQIRAYNRRLQNPGRHACRGGFAVCPATASTQRSRNTKSCSHCGPEHTECFFQHRLNTRIPRVMALPMITRSGALSSWLAS
jgi:hypothetical protein